MAHQSEKYTVTFLPDNQAISISSETSLLSAARFLNIPLSSDCGGAGICGKCRIKLLEGKIHSDETFILTEKESRAGYMLACKSYPRSNIRVEIPESSLARGIEIEGVPYHKLEARKIPYCYEPLVEKVYVDCLNPSGSNNLSDFDRLSLCLKRKTGISKFSIPYSVLQKLPHFLRRHGWRVCVTFSRAFQPPKILDIGEKCKMDKNYGVAIDIGTTNIEGILVEIGTGKILQFISHLNPQVKYGEDVISRLNFADTENGLLILNDIIIDKINEILMELMFNSAIDRDDVHSIVLSGNTVMLHFALALETTHLRKEPYVPVTLNFPLLSAGELYLHANSEAVVFISPCVGSYVGGDLIFSLLATGMPDENFILMDIGTNGEVASVIDGAVACAATSAGPALEGGGIKSGMRASPGAIKRVFFTDIGEEMTLMTIGNKPPKGICGSGLIDLVANLLSAGIIDKKGKFIKSATDSRIRDSEEGLEFVLAHNDQDERDITITERDIDYFIHSKAAIYSGFDFLLRKAGKNIAEIDRIYISGALGGQINIESGIAVGLFPDIDLDRFVFLGNGSLHGGRFVLLSREAREKALEIAGSAVYFELAQEEDFMNEYTSSLFLPHTDINRFPSIRRKIVEKKGANWR